MDTGDRIAPPPLDIVRHHIGARSEQLRRLGAENLWIFGSCARNEERSGSDIDIIVRLRPGFGYFDLGEIKALLETDFDIAERLALIREFIEGITREDFLTDKMRQYAVVRALEEICEAASWFTKHQNGADIRAAYPNVTFVRFGNAGNIFRHLHGAVRYDIVWDEPCPGPAGAPCRA